MLQEVLPARSTLAGGKIDREQLTPAFPVDANRDQDGLARDDARLTHLLVTRIENEIGKRLLQPALTKSLAELSALACRSA
jgi:hypothetical protein